MAVRSNVELPQPADQWICRHCQTVALPLRRSRGSVIIAIVLWFFFLIPGLIYTIWMLEGKKEPTCPRCGSKNAMIPLDSPEGQRLLPDPASLPAGWYSDPARKHEWRYWDGSAWTSRVWSFGKEFQASLD